MNTTNAAQSEKTPTHIATIGADSIQFHMDDDQDVVDAFVAKHGGAVPKIEELVDLDDHAAKEAASLKAAAGAMDDVGRARSKADAKAATLSGFSPAETVYARGSRVNETGVENARLSREAWEKRPVLKVAAGEFSKKIFSEKRRDVSVDPRELRMTKGGDLVTGVETGREGDRFAMTEHGFKGFVNRVGLSGGASYLSTCWPELRAINVNHWMKSYAERKDQDSVPGDFKLRTRVNGRTGKREVFAAVGPKYGACDVDKVVAILADNVDSTARAEVVYDGRRLKATAIFHSQVKPEHYVAGEFFQAGVIVRSADDGSSSIKISAVLFQNLCLNLIIIDEQELEVGRIIHVGAEERIAERVKAAVQTAREKIGHFIKKWDAAVEHDLLAELRADEQARCEKEGDDYIPIPVSVAFRGLMNGLIEKQLVPLSKRDRKATLDRLEVCFNEDESSAGFGASHTVTRAAVVNALTRYAHASGALDAFDCYDLEKAASKFLSLDEVPFVEETSN